MAGLRRHTEDITGLIAVTDSGRSTGKVRIALDVPAPGDIRSALTVLAEGDPILVRLFSHRFETEKSEDLNGMAFGNLFLAALTQQEGSFLRAVEESSRLLGLRGRVLPVTLYNTHLCAKLADGSVVEEKVNVPAPGKAPIERMAAGLVRVRELGARPVAAPIIDKWSGPRELWLKQDTIRHDPERVATAIMRLIEERRPRLRALS